MSYYLFDNPKIGIIIALLAEVAVLLCWTFARQRMRAYYFLAGPMILIIVLLLDYFVETDREQLEIHTKTIIKAVEEEDAEAIINLISDKFLFRNYLSKLPASIIIRERLSTPQVQNNIIRKFAVTSVIQDTGKVEFTVVTFFDPKSSYPVTMVRTSWRFDYIRDQDDVYRLQNISMLTLERDRGKTVDVFKFKPGL